MKNKRIVFTAPCVAELLESEIGMPASDQVLVKTVYSTISSGTERANLIGDTHTSILEKPTTASAVFPRIVGYSSSGVVYAVGANVKSVKPRDKVAVSWGTHSLYQMSDENNVHFLEDGNSIQDGALGVIDIFPLAAIRKCHLEMGESAVVMGLGVLGLIAVQLLRAGGAYPVIAVDPVEEKRKKVLSLGADAALDPFATNFTEQVHSLTHGGAKVAVEVTGNGKALDQVLDCMAKLGRIALLGCTRNSDFTIDYYRKVHGPGISLIGAHTNARPQTESSSGLWTTKDDIRTLMQFSANGRMWLGQMVEEIHSPAEAGEVFGRLTVEKHFPVVQFNWSMLGD